MPTLYTVAEVATMPSVSQILCIHFFMVEGGKARRFTQREFAQLAPETQKYLRVWGLFKIDPSALD